MTKPRFNNIFKNKKKKIRKNWPLLQKEIKSNKNKKLKPISLRKREKKAKMLMNKSRSSLGTESIREPKEKSKLS